MISITRIFRFDAAHKLPKHQGRCNRLHGHGYVLEVEVSGPLSENGMIMDFGDLKEVVQRVVLNVMDHQYLNDVMNVDPTAENMVKLVAENLQLEVPSRIEIRQVRIWETHNSFATWRANNL